MAKSYNVEPVKTALQSAKQTLVLLPQNPTVDSVAAALALYLALTKKGIRSTIGCSSQMTVQFNRLFGVDKIKARIGNQNLVISFNYPEDSLEKVSYDKDPANQKFHLTIEPKSGMQPLDVSQVEYSYTGSNADVIFVIGAKSLEDLGDLYKNEKALLDDKSKTMVNVSTIGNASFGTVNLNDPTATGASEIIFSVIKSLDLSLEQDIATNLLAGIEAATQNLAQARDVETFETVTELMKLGGERNHLTASSFGAGGFNSPFMRPASPAGGPQAPTWPRPAMPTQPVQSSPSPDWLKPKVLTGSGSQI